MQYKYIKLRKRKAPKTHGLHGKTAASVLLFINGKAKRKNMSASIDQTLPFFRPDPKQISI